jgi:pimeloyl-ACP methyl ester carboxylesterase
VALTRGCDGNSGSGVSRPALLLVPSFTELEFGIKPLLEEWADVASFDPPGVGAEPLPEGLREDLSSQSPDAVDALDRWREAAADRGLEEVDRHGWNRFLVVADSYGASSAVRLAAKRREPVAGLAIGHASLSSSPEGPRAPVSGQVHDALLQLMRQDRESFFKYGLAQMTRGAIDEELAEEMLGRYPDLEFATAVWEVLLRAGEPIGDRLAELELPLLLAKHDGCLSRTDEGWEDIVAAFPDARTAICPEACVASPVFAEAIRAFADELGDWS